MPLAGTVVQGDLFLRGAGDPALGEPQLAQLAEQLSPARRDHRLRGGRRVAVRRACAPARRATALFDPELGGPLSALAYDRGAAAPGGPVQADPARAAAARLDDLLEARGVVIRGVPARGRHAAGRAPASGWPCSLLDPMLQQMLTVSDDWIAEILTKRLAALGRAARHDRGGRRARSPARRRGSARG